MSALTCRVMDMGEGVLQSVDHGQRDQLHVHWLHRGHAPSAGMTSLRTVERQEPRMRMERLLEDAELPNWYMVCESVNDDIFRVFYLGVSSYLQLLCNDTRRWFVNIVNEKRSTASFYCFYDIMMTNDYFINTTLLFFLKVFFVEIYLQIICFYFVCCSAVYEAAG